MQVIWFFVSFGGFMKIMAPKEFALHLAKIHGIPIFFDFMGNASQFVFPYWELVACPDGRITDAVPVEYSRSKS